VLLNELRAGTLGRISLETPDMVEQELVEAQAREQAEAEERARKDEQRKKKKR
jgi:ribosome biogenesis GTPase A